jgi:phage tail protein X
VTSYLAKDGERLDQIIYKYYGSLVFFDKIIDQNTHLMDKLVLDSGDVVFLPQINFNQKETKVAALWD